MLSRNNIVSVHTIVKNPQSNAVAERLHQILKTTITISSRKNPPQSFEEVSSPIQHKCAAAQFTIRETIQSNHPEKWHLEDTCCVPSQDKLVGIKY